MPTLLRYSLLTIIACLFLACSSAPKKPEGKYFYPPEFFSVFQGELNKKPTVGSFNVGYKDYNYREAYPWCLKLAFKLDKKGLFPNDLPMQPESDSAYALESEYLVRIRSLGPAHFIGHLFNDGYIDIYVYLEKPDAVRAYLQARQNSHNSRREFEFEIVNDPEWSSVRRFLK
ncbi:MAG: DUF695 domain-containing protein [Bacteroidota bacterium]